MPQTSFEMIWGHLKCSCEGWWRLLVCAGCCHRTTWHAVAVFFKGSRKLEGVNRTARSEDSTNKLPWLIVAKQLQMIREVRALLFVSLGEFSTDNKSTFSCLKKVNGLLMKIWPTDLNNNNNNKIPYWSIARKFWLYNCLLFCTSHTGLKWNTDTCVKHTHTHVWNTHTCETHTHAHGGPVNMH